MKWALVSHEAFQHLHACPLENLGWSYLVGCFSAIYRPEPTFDRTGEQQFHQAFIPAPFLSFQPIFAAVDAFDLEFLPRLDCITLPYFSRENDLAFRGNSCFQGA